VKNLTLRVFATSAILLALSAVASADPLAIAHSVDDRVNDAVLTCNPHEMIDLYEDKALAIYPGEGEIAHNKSEIEKLVRNFFIGFCPDEHKKAGYKDFSFTATPLGPKYIEIVRVMDVTDKDGNLAHMRTTEVIHESGGKWRYVFDHASIGVPPAPVTK
jgi:hypothetical protein